MSILDRRRQLQQQIAQLPDDQLTQVEQYLAFLSFPKKATRTQPIKNPVPMADKINPNLWRQVKGKTTSTRRRK